MGNSADCSRFYQSTKYGTAQLCEWHGICSAATVVECSQPPPPIPPESPVAPPPTLLAATMLAREALRGNASTSEAAVVLKESVTRTMHATLNRIKPVVDVGSEAVAKQVGVTAWQVELSAVAFVVLFWSMIIYGFVYI